MQRASVRAFVLAAVGLLAALAAHASDPPLDSEARVAAARQVEALFDTWGKKAVMRVVRDARFGLITIDVDGRLLEMVGPPREDFVTPETVVIDLARIPMSIEELREKVEASGPPPRMRRMITMADLGAPRGLRPLPAAEGEGDGAPPPEDNSFGFPFACPSSELKATVNSAVGRGWSQINPAIPMPAMQQQSFSIEAGARSATLIGDGGAVRVEVQWTCATETDTCTGTVRVPRIAAATP